MSEALDNRRLVIRLLAVVVGMFAFGFALVPIYDVMCQAFGINGKTAGVYQGQQAVDESRQVRVQFLATNSADMVWEFHPKADELTVVAGASNEMLFVAHNPTDKPMTAQAMPTWRYAVGTFGLAIPINTIRVSTLLFYVDILGLDASTFRIRSHNPGAPVDIELTAAPERPLPKP